MYMWLSNTIAIDNEKEEGGSIVLIRPIEMYCLREKNVCTMLSYFSIEIRVTVDSDYIIFFFVTWVLFHLRVLFIIMTYIEVIDIAMLCR